MKPHAQYIFRLFDSEYYETLDAYEPSDELIRIVRGLIPSNWLWKRGNKWFYTFPSEIKLPVQGWKIHISATPANCEAVLHTTAEVCIRRETAFKFSLDKFFVALTTSKGWPREASGKFITIYPLNDADFRELLSELYASLQGFIGPYVLSDRRYRDSQVIYYRYGGINGLNVLSYRGEKEYMLVSPSGDLVPDIRSPYWNPPSWVSDDLFQQSNEQQYDSKLTLKNGRYSIENVLSFSVTGGVYLATDESNNTRVVIKEARPATGVDKNNIDAVDRLRKEFRLLQKLSGTNITPEPIDLFQDWEHLFLVEEYIPGHDLGIFTISFTPLYQVQADEKDKQIYLDKIRKIWIDLVQKIATVHEKGIILGDLTVKNVIVKDIDYGDVRLIDLETAWEENIDMPTQISTPGFFHPTQKGVSSKEADIYAVGSIMLTSLHIIHGILDLEPSARKAFIDKCMCEEMAARPSPHQIITGIRQNLPLTQTISIANFACTPKEELARVVSETTKYIRASADLRRKDRLFPADPMIFFTNPLSIAYGATGVTYALSKIEKEVPKRILAWIISQQVDKENYPPGLYIGSAGIAWALWELGLQDIAEQTLRSSNGHPLLWDSADIFYGASGYGLTCLHFYLVTGKQEWLDKAVQVGEWLLHSRVESERGCCWLDKEGKTWLSYAKGASGIALYLLYLSAIVQENKYLEVGEQALAFDLSYLQLVGEKRMSVPRGSVGNFEKVITHYWINGSAGVATTLVRFWYYTQKREYLDTFERLALDTARKYTVFPGLFQGLSGLGNFLLDAYTFTGKEFYLQEAYKVTDGILLYKLQRNKGVAFPGEQLYRISTDFGTGSAGIALFLNRLLHIDERPENFNFTLDRILFQPLIGDDPYTVQHS